MAGEGVTSVREMLHRSVRYHGENEALVDERYRYSYAQMLEKVQQTAALLHSLGVRKGDRVALMMLPSANHPLALFVPRDYRVYSASMASSVFPLVSDSTFRKRKKPSAAMPP